jgi:putative ABC transport system permease protein
MYRIATKMLLGDAAKYSMLVSTLAVVSFLIMQQGSLFCGVILRTARAVDVIGAPIWVCDPQLRHVEENKPLLDTDLERVRSAPGVKWAVPLIMQFVDVRLADGNVQTARLYGLDNTSFFGLPGDLLEGSEDLRQAASVVIGQAESDKLNSPRPGDTFEINNAEARVVGIASVSRDFFAYPFVYTAYDQALNYLPVRDRQMNFILAAPREGLTAETVSRNISAAGGLRAYTEDGIRWLTMEYYLAHSGITIQIGLGVTMSFLAGMMIVGQTFYQFALQNERFLGALKAMGAGKGVLTQMILLQSLLVGIVGFGTGSGLLGLFCLAFGGSDSRLALATPWQVMAISLAAVLLICLVSALISVQRVARLEPAVVFRG